MLKLGFLASHTGSNVQAIVEASRTGGLDAEPCVVVSNNSRSGALKKARAQGIAAYHLSERTHPGVLDEMILATMRHHEVELVCLSGYMKPLGLRMLAAYGRRILNVHPSLLPKYGGEGMFGLHVHEAVLASGERESGATVHLVVGGYDEGQVLAQERVPVWSGDAPTDLQARVLAVEHRIYTATLAKVARGEIDLDLAMPQVL